MYKKVSTDLNFVGREKEVEKFWDDNHIFEKSMENRKEGETYTFYDGPPTANGKPHIGHVLTPRHQGHDPQIPDHEGLYGAQEGRLGHPRPAGGTGSGEGAGPGRQGPDRGSTAWSPSSTNVRRVSGNTRACGRTSPARSASGPTWSTPT